MSTASGATELVSMRWGLIPWWWKKTLKELPASFNARAETVAAKPMFRDAFRRNRCVIPASGYYEWLKKPDGRQPYFISAADGDVLSFAGLWDRWKNPKTGEPVISCTIIVTDANELTRPISRPHAGGTRQGGYRAMAGRRGWHRAAKACR
jgi:putative SOS response-associated peptidase YedK